MSVLANRVKVATATTGTGPIDLGTALTGYQSFADGGITNGQVVSYAIEDGAAWEIGTGTYTTGTPDTLSRTVIESSNSDAEISLTGNAVVFITALSGDLQNAVDMDQGVATTDGPSFAGITATTADINGGTIDGTVIGGSTPAAITGTTGQFNTSLNVDGTIKLDGNYPVGTGNVALGNAALDSNVSGASNTAIGADSLTANTASNNTAVGYQAGSAITTGAKNTIIGCYSGNQGGLDISTLSNYIVLSDGDGNPRAYYTNTGLYYNPQSYNNTTGAGANMVVESTGAFARSTSSLKYKREVQNATHGLAQVLQLRPVTYKGKSENDGETIFGGLIAEEVHEAGLTEFVQYDDEGRPDALAYGNMVSLCIKAIQEQQTIITGLEARIAALESA